MADPPRVLVVPHLSRPIAAQDVRALYRVEGWWPERTVDQIDAVLASGPAVGAWHGDELVGFARGVTGGVLRAYVEDVIVQPRLRGTGIARTLMKALLKELDPAQVITLFCPPGLVSFYESSGFRSTKQVVLHRSR